MTKSHEAEITYLLARCRLILSVLRKDEPNALVLAELDKVLEQTAAKGNVRGLRSIRRDLLEMSQVLPQPARDELHAALALQEKDDPIHDAAS